MRHRKSSICARVICMASLIVFFAHGAFAQSGAEELAAPREATRSSRNEPELDEREPTTPELFEGPKSAWLEREVEDELPPQWVEANDLANPEEDHDSAENSSPPKKGGPPVGGFGGMMGGGGPPGYTINWLPTQSVANQPSDLGILRQSFSFAAPLRRRESGMLMATLQLSDSHFFTNAVLPDTQRPFPTDLANIGLGLSYMHRFANGWSGVVISNFGSASDKPFHALRDMNYMTGGFLQIPVRNERDSWMLGAIYSPVGMLNFPIPMVAYSWRPSDAFHMNIGLPLSVMWKPTDAWTVNVSYVPLTNINAITTYQLSKQLSLYGGYRFLNDSHFLADRQIDQDRFFGFEQQVFCGAKIHVWRNAVWDIGAGYAFDRRYGEGRNQTAELHDVVRVAPTAYLSTGLGWQF